MKDYLVQVISLSSDEGGSQAGGFLKTGLLLTGGSEGGVIDET